MKLPFYGVGLDLPHLVSQIWSVRIGIKICEIAVLQGVDLPPLVGQIWFLIWQLIFGRLGVAKSTPYIKWQFHRFWFLFWQLIFGQPGVADLPPVEQQFHRFWFLFWHFIFDWPGVADLTQPHRMAISQILIPILTAHIWQTRGGWSTPTP